MNQILFEMYIGVITNFQKEPDYAATGSLLQKQYLHQLS